MNVVLFVVMFDVLCCLLFVVCRRLAVSIRSIPLNIRMLIRSGCRAEIVVSP